MKRPAKILIICLLAVTMLVFSGCSGCTSFDPANDSRYDPSGCNSSITALTAKTIYWLGSSVTLGMTSGNIAIPEYIAARNGAVSIKDAVNGTTLIDNGKKSYVARLKEGKALGRASNIDAFVCQLSTNDAKKANKSSWGNVTAPDMTSLDLFDTSTTLGGLEYVIAYAKATWNCPVFIYTNAWFGDKGDKSVGDPSGTDYCELVDKSKKAVEKWNRIGDKSVTMIDLFGNEEFNDISDKDYDFYMHDAVHPYKAGYLEWWTPEVERAMLKDIGRY